MDPLGDFLYGKGSVGWSLYENIVEWKMACSTGGRNHGQMDLPGTLDENGIGHRDVGANQWHPDAVLGNAAGEIDKDAPIATRFTRRHTYEGEARISRKITVPDYGTDRLFVLAERARHSGC